MSLRIKLFVSYNFFVVKERNMEKSDLDSIRLDKTALSVAPLFDAADDKAYWLSRTPQARLQHIEYLRRMNYGHRATARLQRVLEIAQRPVMTK